jgi:cysteine synthase A
MKKSDRFSNLVGKTPLILLENYAKRLHLNCKLYAKAEYLSVYGSAKDRPVKFAIEKAEKRGDLKRGDCVVEATSGNTGVALAAICAEKGYRAVVVSPDNISKEKAALIQGLGAELILTSAKRGMAGAVERAKKICAFPHHFALKQFENCDFVTAQREIGKEIKKQLKGGLDVLVAGVGTGATLMGAGEYLKKHCARVRVFAVEPTESPVLSGGAAGEHGIAGIGAGFIPPLFRRGLCDGILRVSEKQALYACRLIAKTEGAFVGVSAGAALFAASILGARADMVGAKIAVILPDGGERYLSSHF